MNSQESKTLAILRSIWKQGYEILGLLDSYNSDERYAGLQRAQRWSAHAMICFERLFYSSKFSDDFQKLIATVDTDDFGNWNMSSLAMNRLIGHIEGLGQMLKFGYIKDQFSGVNNEASNSCFIAMSFASEYEDIFSIGIKPAVETLGYKAIRVDKERHNEKIDSKIVELILDARFVVADFTGQRNGVYYEAGFAKGLGLPVIHTCMNRDLANLHFDIRTINTLHYDSPSKLTAELQEQISATIGSYKPPAIEQSIESNGDTPF